MPQGSALNGSAQQTDSRTEHYLESGLRVQQCTEGWNRLQRGRQISVPIADIVGASSKGEQYPSTDRLSFTDVPRQITDSITLGIIVVEGFEYVDSAVRAPVVDKEK